MIKLCVFDLDGTIADTITTIDYYGNNALNEYGLPSIEREKYKILVGDGAVTLVERMLKEVGCDDKELFDKVYKKYVEDYDKDFMYLTEVYEGVTELIDDLRSKGIKIAVFTNKPEFTALKVIDILLGDRVDLCMGNAEGRPKKPDPTGLFEIMKNFGVSGDECLYIGDTSTDMKTGNGGRCHTVGVLWGFRDRAELEENNAEFIIEKPDEILEIIEKMA
ncbi:MAG: HAD family hydrolase [Ruminococcaceae bacterium]|nr:HAD family hydrolase [Oscillospiraceae bacterium]